MLVYTKFLSEGYTKGNDIFDLSICNSKWSNGPSILRYTLNLSSLVCDYTLCLLPYFISETTTTSSVRKQDHPHSLVRNPKGYLYNPGLIELATFLNTTSKVLP